MRRLPIHKDHRKYATLASYPHDTGPSNILIIESEVETDIARVSRRRLKERFLKGPISMPQISTASCLPGKALAVFIAIHHRVALTGKDEVTLPSELLQELGVDRDAKSRALRQLEYARLAEVRRSKGRTARIRLMK